MKSGLGAIGLVAFLIYTLLWVQSTQAEPAKSGSLSWLEKDITIEELEKNAQSWTFVILKDLKTSGFVLWKTPTGAGGFVDPRDVIFEESGVSLHRPLRDLDGSLISPYATLVIHYPITFQGFGNWKAWSAAFKKCHPNADMTGYHSFLSKDKYDFFGVLSSFQHPEGFRVLSEELKLGQIPQKLLLGPDSIYFLEEKAPKGPSAYRLILGKQNWKAYVFAEDGQWQTLYNGSGTIYERTYPKGINLDVITEQFTAKELPYSSKAEKLINLQVSHSVVSLAINRVKLGHKDTRESYRPCDPFLTDEQLLILDTHLK